MIRHRFHVALVIVVMTILPARSTVGQEQGVQALFSLDSPTGGPFPSDWFTVQDNTQNTGRRVSLPPLLNCQVNISDCQDLAVINELDGFNLQPRLSVPFNGPIDAGSVTSDTVFLLSLGSTLPGGDDMPSGTVVGIDQVVWDTLTNRLHVESDALLAQHTRFALIVTRGVRDLGGAPVGASEAFRRFRATVRGDYKHALLEAIQTARRIGVREDDIAVASVFTTRSATAVLEKIRDQIHTAPPDPANFILGLNDERTVFSLDQVTGITWSQQAQPLNLSLIRNVVGTIAFGRYTSPDYEVHPGEYIPPVGTRLGTPAVKGTNPIYFNLLLPSGSKPAKGWPVAIFGHGRNQDKNNQPLNVAGSMTANGVATIAINAVGHGLTPAGMLTVSRTAGGPVNLSAGGRGIDQDGNGIIANAEGFSTPVPRRIVFLSDGFRQTAVDLMQLVRVIEVGIDVDGDGQPDLDSSRIYYLGTSLGGGYGTVFMGVEPSVRTGVLNVPFDVFPFSVFSPIQRPAAGSVLASRQPSLLNAPGIAALSGLTTSPPLFDDNTPLRDETPLTVQLADLTTRVIQSPVDNSIAGAMAIQQVLEDFEWVSNAGSPIAYAPHLRKTPLPGVPAKLLLLQIAKGDESNPNPTTTAIVRAGELIDRTVYYRHDLARSENPSWKLPRNPHAFFGDVAMFGQIARDAQAAVGIFFASDGANQPQPTRYFEFPIVGPLPEGLNYLP
jgi:hypothetical protein